MILHHSKSSLNTIKKEKKEIDTLIQKECIKLIQSNSESIYNVTK